MPKRFFLLTYSTANLGLVLLIHMYTVHCTVYSIPRAICRPSDHSVDWPRAEIRTQHGRIYSGRDTDHHRPLYSTSQQTTTPLQTTAPLKDHHTSRRPPHLSKENCFLGFFSLIPVYRIQDLLAARPHIAHTIISGPWYAFKGGWPICSTHTPIQKDKNNIELGNQM